MPSPFETALGKLSALIGDDQPQAPQQPSNAMAVGYRASMLPIGNYEDGSIAFPVWPQGAVDAYEALGRFGRGENPQPQDAVLAGLAMAGGGFGGLGARAAGRAVSGTAPERVAASRPLASSPVEAGLPMDHAARMARAKEMGFDPDRVWYHGTTGRPFATSPDAPTPDIHSFEARQPTDGGGRPLGAPGVYITPDPEAANVYARAQFPEQAGAVYPLYTRAKIASMEDAVRLGDETNADRVARLKQAGFGGYAETGNGSYAVVFDPKDIRSVNAAFDPSKSDSANLLASNPKEAAPAGILAASSLERMRAEDAVKPRPFPDAPQTMPELESYLQKNVDGNSRTRADEAWAEDPTRYNAYSHGMADVLNPESQWWKGEPTLQSGGSVAPAAATGSSEHHSRSQPRGAGGRFVGRESFDGRLASLDKMMVDLDGDGVPDVAVPAAPANAMARMAKADYHGADPTMGPFDIMNPMPSFPSLDYTEDMAVPPDWTINRVPQNTPVMGPGMNPPIPPGYMPPNRR